MNLRTFLFLIILPLFVNSQNKRVLSAEKNISTLLKSNNTYPGRIASNTFKNQIYFTHRSPVTDGKRNIYSYDISGENSKIYTLEYNAKTKSLFTNDIFSFVVLDNCAVFLTNDGIYTFDTQKKIWQLKSIKKNKLNFNCAFPLNTNEALLYVNYNFHPGDADDRHLWAKFDVKSDSIKQVKKMNDENVEFTPFVNSWISVYKGLIAYANTTEYKIRFYNEQFQIVDSIHTLQLEKNKEHLLKRPSAEFSKDAIVSLQQFSDSTLTRIQKIFLLDSTTLMVVKKLPKPKKYEFDLWQKVDGKWNLKINEFVDGFYEEGKAYDSEKALCFDIFGNVNGVELINKKFHFVYFPYLQKISTPAFDRKKDYDDPINQMVRKDELYYGISTYKISNP